MSRSSAARARASFTVRTAWPSFSPASQIGYQMACAAPPGTSAPGVEQEEVEVAARGQLAPAVAADRHQGQARGVLHRPVEERPQPVVDRGGVGHAEVAADDRLIGQQCLSVEDRGRHLGQRQRPARALRAATWIGSHSGENGGA